MHSRAVQGDRERMLGALEDLGERRRAAQAGEHNALKRIASMVPAALDAGIAKREVARRTGLSRVWLDELLRRERRG